MSHKEQYIIRFVKEKYDIIIESSYIKTEPINVVIKVRINFYPKEYSNITSESVVSHGKWIYKISENNLSFEDFVYIRKDEMPIILYTQQEYYLDNFLEDLGFEEVNRILIFLGYKK